MIIDFSESSAKTFSELKVGSIFEYKDTIGRLHTLIKTSWASGEDERKGNAFDLESKLMIPMDAYDEVTSLAGVLIIE